MVSINNDDVKHDTILLSSTMMSNNVNNPIYCHIINDDVNNDPFNPKIYDDFNQ